MPNDPMTIAGQCHCGTVQFEATLSDGFNTIRRCTCSYCRMRGAIAASAEMGGVTILKGEEALTSYRFNTGTAQHFFCSQCGIYTHHQRRSNPSQYGVNVACLAGVSPFDFEEVPVVDGVNHPNDVGGPTKLVGILCFDREVPSAQLNDGFRPIVGRFELAPKLPLADIEAMQENARLVAEIATKRLILIGEPNGLWRFVEDSHYEGDEYTGPYFAPTHFSGLYESADAAERDARAMLPWLRDG